MDENLPDPQVVPYLLYANADAAMDWLVKAFGYLGPARLGGATQLLRIMVTDLDAHRGRTAAFTGEASEPQTGPPGWRAYSVSDPEGHQWYFTEPVGPAPRRRQQQQQQSQNNC